MRSLTQIWLVLLVCAASCVAAPGAWAIVSSNAGTTIFNGVNVNGLIGAEDFYARGYWGSTAVIANIEAGLVWNGHETLTHVDTYFGDPSTMTSGRQYDWHATMVGQVLNGRGILYGASMDNFDFASLYGVAPNATLWSGAISTGWDVTPGEEYGGSFNTTDQSLVYAYRTAMIDGIGGRTADVINSSWGFSDPAGSALETRLLDALACASGKTLVFAAGNHSGPTNEPVGGPASGYNSISVAAMGGDTLSPPYSAVATFSNRGPGDYVDPLNGQSHLGVRATVDIAAPGDNMTLAFYGGVTGGHATGTDPVAGSGSYYIPDMGGTSFASPVVAGAAALLVDVGRTLWGDGKATNARVLKAVLLNSASKTEGWTNGQSVGTDGVVRTTQSLDWAVGAGTLNLHQALPQYMIGTTDVPGFGGGRVAGIGWDYGQISPDGQNDYYIDGPLKAGSQVTVTLDWFVQRKLDATGLDTTDEQFGNLDLQLFQVTDGMSPTLIAESISQYNNVEHLFLGLPSDGFYMLRVKWAGVNYADGSPTEDPYGLAWNVPEPGSILLLMLAVPAVLRRRMRKAAR